MSQYNKEYWDRFYGDNDHIPKAPSSFAEYVLPKVRHAPAFEIFSSPLLGLLCVYIEHRLTLRGTWLSSGAETGATRCTLRARVSRRSWLST